MLPELKLDSDSFENLIEEYRSQIAGIYPDWTDYNYHDPGITFLELFVWMQENQQFFMEQLGKEHYRQFFRMAGITPQGRRPAFVMAEAVERGRRRSVSIPEGAVFYSGGLAFETLKEERVPAAWISRLDRRNPAGRTVFYAENDSAMDHRGLALRVFGSEPEKGASLNLFVEGELREGIIYRLSLQMAEQGRNPLADNAFVSLAELKWEYRTAAGWAPLTILEDETHELLYSGRIAFRMESGPMAGGTEPQLRVVFSAGQYDAVPVLHNISLTEIELQQVRRWVWPEGKLLAEGNGFPRQEFTLMSEKFLADTVEISAEDILHPGKMIPWRRVDDLLEAGPEDLCYVLDEYTGTVLFGDGFHGLPPEGRIVVTAISETAGADGNVKEKSIFTVQDPALRAEGIPAFRMSRMISAGRDPEKKEETLLRIVREQHRVRRAVTCRDYEALAMETPGLIIHSAHAWTEEEKPKTVNIVVRAGTEERALPLSEAFCSNIASHLESRRLLGTTISLHSPDYIRVNVSCEIIPAPEYRDCEDMIKEELGKYFAEKNSTYGLPLEFGELYGRLERLPCVRRINSLQLEPTRADVRRNRNRDLLASPGGIFLQGKTEVFLNHYGN